MDYRLKTIFENTFIDFNGNFEMTDEKLLNFYNIVCEFEHNEVSHCSWLMRNYHYFYTFCLIFNELNKENEEHIVKTYLPSIFFILQNTDTRLITHINSIFTKSKTVVKKQIEKISDFAPILNEEKIRIDALNIFFRSFFLDVDPINILNLEDFYLSAVNHILLTYLKNYDYNKTIDLLDDINYLLTLQEKTLTKCNRVIVYDNALKRVEIDSFIVKSDYISIIDRNLKILEKSIVSNDIQDLFNKLVIGTKIPNPKLSILSILDNKHELLNLIDIHCPFVHKLLRSVCIDINQQLDQNKFSYSKAYIAEAIYNCLIKHKFDPEKSDILSTSIAISFATSLCSKEYFDILTLKKVEIHTSLLWDLKTLLVYLLTGKIGSSRRK